LLAPGSPTGGASSLTSRARIRIETPVEAQARQLRERIALELAEFAKQSLIQGLYSQRGKLMETQQKAQEELSSLEARLAMLQLPLQDRIKAYEHRIGELEKQLETRDEEMRGMIEATLMLVRERLEKEKTKQSVPSRFN
jgi:isocitrate dehydrogenase kinase/phosphatase